MNIKINYSRNKIIDIIYIFVNRVLGNIYDPLVISKIGNFYLKHRFSHKIPFYLRDFPKYNVNMAKVAQIVSKKYKDITIIDVGANIGDSVALIKSLIDVPILSIEGNPNYFWLLKENTNSFKDVLLENVMVADNKDSLKGRLINNEGTGYMETNNDLNTYMRLETIDNLLKIHQKFKNSKFIKIDTDGFDGKVIRGCKDYLRRTKPIVFFEYAPNFLKKVNDDGESILLFLRKLGYTYILIYDNTGEYLCSCNFSNLKLLKELTNYVSGKTNFKYYDMCVFSKKDTDIFNYMVKINLSNHV